MSRPAGGHVGGDQDVERSVAEAAHDPVAALLRQPAVERAGIVAAGAQRLGEIVDLAARPPEDQRRGRVLDIEDAAQRGELVGAAHDVGDLADERGRRRPTAVSAWTLIRAGSRRWRFAMRVMVGEIVAEKSAVWRSAGVADRIASRSSAKPMSSISSASSRMTTRTASKRRLPRFRWSTARPGRRDDDVDAAPEAAQLLADRLAAVDRQDPRAELAAVLRERLGDLHRELARRDQDERRGAPVAGLADGDALERRQREGGRLAGPRRRLGQQVAAGQQRRDRLALDRRRLLVAERRDGAQQAGVELERGEPVGDAGASARRGPASLRQVGVYGHADIVVQRCAGQRAPAIGSRSIVRTRRVPPASVRTVAAGMTPGTRRSTMASSPANRPGPADPHADADLEAGPPGAGRHVDGDEVRADHRRSRVPPRRVGAPLVWVRATG